MLEGENRKQLAETLSYLMNSHFFPGMWMTLEFEQTHKLAFYYSQPEELKSCLDDNSARHCDKSRGNKAWHHKPSHPPVIHIAHSSTHTYTNTTGDLSPTHTEITEISSCSHSSVWVITCFHYIFHTGPIKLESGYESWIFQPLLSCLLLWEEPCVHTSTQSSHNHQR